MAQLAFRLGYGRYGIVGNDSAERLLNLQLLDTEEMREDYPTSFINQFSYRGIATNGSSTANTVWDVIRTSYDGNGNRSRVQYRSQISWDLKASGWGA